MKSSNHHITVLLNETINSLKMVENGIYVDCTLGMGGHSKLLLKKLLPNSQLICFDKDLFAINHFKTYIEENKIKNVTLIHDDYVNLKKHLNKLGIENVDGIIFDLGVSSPQLDNFNRGFSYLHDGPLDMRMNQNQELQAYDVINTYPVAKLKQIFYEYGQSKYATQVANAIVKYRVHKKIDSTLELVEIIKSALPKKECFKEKHPARVFFQAIRIEVNGELINLKSSMVDAIDLLKPNGVLAIITFHSLEDKIVKDLFKEVSVSRLPPYLPIETNNEIKYQALKKIVPKSEEILNNNRARSAVLRIIKRKEIND